MANHNICIGIDLGTTNSVIAWGRFNPEENAVDPQVIEIPMLNTNEEVIERRLLPSCVHFREGDAPIVGEYGKSRTSQSELDRTFRSFKTKMGIDRDDTSYNATYLSSRVLEQLKSGAEQTLFRNIPFPDNVAIAVPASFEPHMCEATMKAAQLVGFKNPILVDEPIAAIHDFHDLTRLAGGMLFERFDFSTPKLVLVFDLGGGTLDVSLHEVCSGRTQLDLEISTEEKSRFTKIGGDDFDQKLTYFLINKYQEEDPDQSVGHELKAKFRLYAEGAKIRLSTEIEQRQSFYGQIDELDPDSFTKEIKGIPAKGKSFSYELSLSEYEKCVESLLGRDLTLDSVDQYNLSKDPDNIIDPILYVLKKRKNTLGYIPKPDIVLLNGSMAKLYTIQKRLKDFFGFPPVDVGDMDLAVARGAVVYLVKEIRNANL